MANSYTQALMACDEAIFALHNAATAIEEATKECPGAVLSDGNLINDSIGKILTALEAVGYFRDKPTLAVALSVIQGGKAA